MDSDDSMTTKMSSKRSRSRVESDRGPKRGQRNLERARKDKVAKGESWVARDMLRRQAAEAATGLHGSVAEEVQEQKMHEKKAEALPQPEEKQKLIEDALMDAMEVDLQRWVKEKNGHPFCFICEKRATASHITSSEHLKKVEEDALGTLLFGKAKSTRRFDGDMCKGIPTKKKR